MSLNKTPIEWVRGPDGKPGHTWNPIVGCSRGCPYCYARRLAKRQRQNCERCYEFVPHLHPERLADPAKRKKPTGIFVCSMGELFEPRPATVPPVPDVGRVFDAMMAAPQHRYYLLTKRPDEAQWLLSRLGRRENWWVGTSASTQADVNRCIPTLLQLRAHGDWPILYASIEPILGPVDLTPWLSYIHEDVLGVVNPECAHPQELWPPFHDPWVRGLDWVIIGAQTGPGAVRPDPAWVQALIDQCREACVPVFLKDNLRWPEQIREMPEG